MSKHSETTVKEYMNTHPHKNVFTENGRCCPGETIEMTIEQAKAYPDLKEVHKPPKKEPASE